MLQISLFKNLENVKADLRAGKQLVRAGQVQIGKNIAGPFLDLNVCLFAFCHDLR